MAPDVAFRASARADLKALTRFIAERSGVDRALSFVDRIEERCLGLGDHPMAGRSRPELGDAFRTIALDRRVLIVYSASEQAIEIVRVLYGGRDVDALLAEDDPLP